MSERRCLVALCTNLPMVPVQTAQSLMELGWGDRVARAKAAHGFAAIDHAWYRTFPRVDALRDSAADMALTDGYTHLLYLDADNIWPSDVLFKMLRHAALDAVVGGLYVMRHPPFAPVALRDGVVPEGSTVTQYQHDDAVASTPDAALREVDVLGMGCTLIPTAVFRAIGPRPWFVYANDDAGWPCVTEDVPFCQRAKTAGYRILLDPSVSCGHVTSMVTDIRWHETYQRTQQGMMDALPFRVSWVTSPQAEPEAAV